VFKKHTGYRSASYKFRYHSASYFHITTQLVKKHCTRLTGQTTRDYPRENVTVTHITSHLVISVCGTPTVVCVRNY